MEAFLYCMGAIKFISGNPRFLNEMISKGAVEILMNLIKQINDDTKKCGTCLPNSGHLLVQVSILIEKVVCVKWVFMFPRTHYLPGDCNREQVGCYLQPGGGYLALGIERSSHCPPHTPCVFPLERLFHGCSPSISLHSFDIHFCYSAGEAGLGE